MRRKDREQGRDFALEVMKTSEYATLATVNADGSPYCVAVSQVVMGDAIYFHGALAGQKVDNLKADGRVCLSAVRNTKLLPMHYTTAYESAVACGSCTIVADENEKIAALRVICEKYAPTNMANFDDAVQKALSRLCIFKIDIHTITGKANHE